MKFPEILKSPLLLSRLLKSSRKRLGEKLFSKHSRNLLRYLRKRRKKFPDHSRHLSSGVEKSRFFIAQRREILLENSKLYSCHPDTTAFSYRLLIMEKHAKIADKVVGDTRSGLNLPSVRGRPVRNQSP